MDIESRLRAMEADVRRTKTCVEILLVVVLVPVGLGLLGVSDAAESLLSILVILALIAAAHLLVTAASGLRRFRAGQDVDAQLQERILREFVAERHRARN